MYNFSQSTNRCFEGYRNISYALRKCTQKNNYLLMIKLFCFISNIFWAIIAINFDLSIKEGYIIRNEKGIIVSRIRSSRAHFGCGAIRGGFSELREFTLVVIEFLFLRVTQ
jgi:hypothetical protein